MKDTQLVELKARSLLYHALWTDGIEVAIPVRDRGIDVIAYVDGKKPGAFLARPIQIKSASRTSFGIDKKYRTFPDLLIVHVWNVDRSSDVRFFATKYQDALTIARRKGWLKTSTWKKTGRYSSSQPDKTLLELLKKFEVEAGQWRAKLQ